VRNRHEFGQGRAAKQCVVGAIEVHHLEPDWLTVIIVLFSEQHFQLDSPHWCAGVSRHDSIEG
jgi:hypothetical protein